MHRRSRALVALGSTFVLIIGLVGPTSGVERELTVSGEATQLGEPIHEAKSRTGQLAETDPALLNRTDPTRVAVMIKLDYDPVASYAGDIAGLAATSPQVTGESLDENATAVAEYSEHLGATESTTLAAIEVAVPAVTVTESFQTAYGGVAATMPANQVGALLGVEGVAAVQQDALQQPLTDSTPDFIGATEAWSGLGGPTTAGEGVIVGILDSGIWPEHPSFADTGVLTPPALPAGGWECQFGDGSDPALGDAFECNDKLIGAYSFVDTYMTLVGAEDGEFCSNTTGECSARDANGHGTHTASTAAGGPVASTPLLGVDRGPISGIAPGAHVIAYRVCLEGGCFSSDSAAAVDQAILDGVDVINFSISGGANAFTDPVELAFLDAYAAGIVVNASAGNSGPGASTADHAGPWTTTVGASTSNRHFLTTLILASSAGSTLDITGATVTGGIAPTAVVLARDVAGYSDAFCQDRMPADTARGLIVACERGIVARVSKSFNVAAGGAAGIILYNLDPANGQGLNTDNHFVPSVHIDQPDGTAFLTFMENAGVTATWGRSSAVEVTGDVMASFSSRGPLGEFLKPDVTAPGAQILAGHTPEPLTEGGGVPGELFQAIQGTSMSSPHSAGVAALVRAAHPGWSAGQIKSALMTSSVQSVLKDDNATPATPFDRGAGSIRADRAVSPTLTFDVSAEEYAASAADPLGRVHLNLPSIYVDPMPGAISTTRTAMNVSGIPQEVRLRVQAPTGSTVTVTPSRFLLDAGATREITITIDGTNLADGLYFGQVTLDVNRGNEAVLPLAFNRQQGSVSLTHSCDPVAVPIGTASHCTVIAQNLIPAQVSVSLAVTPPGRLTIRSVSGPGVASGGGFSWQGTLSGSLAPTVTGMEAGAGQPYGYFPMSLITAPEPAYEDETIVNYLLPVSFDFGSETYDTIGVTSNGYLVVGGGDQDDLDCCSPQTFPNTDRPNNVLAPFWTDLDPEDGGNIYVAIVGDGVDEWVVVEWEAMPEWDSAGAVAYTTQVWLNTGTEEITYTYARVDGNGTVDGLAVGAENRDGSSGVNLGSVPARGSQYLITTEPPAPGGSVTITYDARSWYQGTYRIPATMTSDVMNGKTITVAGLEVTRRRR